MELWVISSRSLYATFVTTLKEGLWVKTSTGVKGPTPWVSDKHATEPTEPTEPMILHPYAGLVASGVDRPRIRWFWRLIHEGKKNTVLGTLF